MTQYELLFIMLSSLNFPATYKGFKIQYYKEYAQCDIIVNEYEVTIEQKIHIMNKMLEQFDISNIKFNDVDKIEVDEVLKLF